MNNDFQQRVNAWMMNCFSMEICRDIQERNHRFLEESLELVQSLGCTKEEALLLINYTFNRPAGDPENEVGGVMVTLAALCNPAGIDMVDEAVKELLRISTPEMINKIRQKQLTKPKHSPLPSETEEMIPRSVAFSIANRFYGSDYPLQRSQFDNAAKELGY